MLISDVLLRFDDLARELENESLHNQRAADEIRALAQEIAVDLQVELGTFLAKEVASFRNLHLLKA